MEVGAKSHNGQVTENAGKGTDGRDWHDPHGLLEFPCGGLTP